MSRIKPTWVQIKAKLVGFLGTFKLFDPTFWTTVYAIYFASLIFRESGLQDIFASG